MRDLLYCITVVENYANYQRRYQLYREFWNRMVAERGAVLYTVELAYPGQDFAVTSSNRVTDIQVRAKTPMFHKENLINIALKRLPTEAQNIAWLDADITFARPDWVDATLAALKKHGVVQCFSHALDLGPTGVPVSCGIPITSYLRYILSGGGSDRDIHAMGFAWAARREVFRAGLYDRGILDGGDYFMLTALVGSGLLPRGIYPADFVSQWEGWRRSLTREAFDLGYVDGLVLHHWHGSRANRQGRPAHMRAESFLREDFSIARDLYYNENGVLEFRDPNCSIAIAAREYFMTRCEDSLVVSANEASVPPTNVL